MNEKGDREESKSTTHGFVHLRARVADNVDPLWEEPIVVQSEQGWEGLRMRSRMTQGVSTLLVGSRETPSLHAGAAGDDDAGSGKWGGGGGARRKGRFEGLPAQVQARTRRQSL